MSRHERDGFLKSMAKGLAKWVLSCGGLLSLGILGLLMIIGVSFSIFYLNLGIFGVYAAVTALIVLIGWAVYNTDQGGREGLIERMNSVGWFIDMVDAVLIFAAWFAFAALTAGFDEDLAEAFDALFVPIAVAVTWFRRRFFPSTVVRFQSQNAFLRTASILSVVHSVITFLFGVSADAIDSPVHHARIFYLVAGLLVLVAVWAHRIETQNAAKSSRST